MDTKDFNRVTSPPNPWPPLPVVKAAIRGLAEVVRAEDGSVVRGVLATGAPWIVWDGSVVGCSRCGTVEANPPPVMLDPEKASRATQPSAYALHVLATLLHPFFRRHVACVATAKPGGYSP